MALNVLFIGGTGIISSACSQLAVERGINLTLFNRGVSHSTRPVPEGAQVITGDINNPVDIAQLAGEHTFDVIVNWIAYQPEEVARDVAAFQGKTGQYIFISSASAYQKPVQRLPITEETPLENPYWDYSRAKIACEQYLFEAHQNQSFPATIVRPSHTYDKTLFPFHGGYTNVDRMRKGMQVIVHGDGTSLWVFTHHRDFAQGFVGLLGNEQAIGEAYHITSDVLLTWNQLFEAVAAAAKAEFNPFYVPSTVIAKYDPAWGAGLVGDKAYSVIFDNSKIKSLVPGFSAEIPFSDGSREIMEWYDEDPARQVVDEEFSQLSDRIISEYGRKFS